MAPHCGHEGIHRTCNHFGLGVLGGDGGIVLPIAHGEAKMTVCDLCDKKIEPGNGHEIQVKEECLDACNDRIEKIFLTLNHVSCVQAVIDQGRISRLGHNLNSLRLTVRHASAKPPAK